MALGLRHAGAPACARDDQRLPLPQLDLPESGGTHYMVVNREVREGAGARGGDTVSVVMERDDEPRTIEPPADLLRALRADRAARATWERLSYTHRKKHVRAVEEAKRPGTRARRIEKSIALLAAGKKEFR